MSGANPFGISAPLISPMMMPPGNTQDPWISMSQRHGSAEPNYGGYIRITPPSTPRSPSRRRSLSRDRSREERRSSRHGDESDQPQQGWGPRIVMLEKKVMELENAISITDNSITKKFVDMAEKAGEVDGRIDSIERTLPQRIHSTEHRQIALVETMNALTAAINSKIEQVEQLLLSRLTPAPTPTSPVPPIPPSFGGHQPPTTTPQHFNVGSP